MRDLPTPGAPKKPIPGRCFGPAAILLVVPAAALAQAGGAAPLAEADAVRRALARPAVADVVEGEVAVARGEGIAASRWPNPVLSYTREQILDGGTPGADDHLVLSQELDLGGARALRGRAGRERAGAAERQGAWTRVEIAARVRLLFHDVLRAQGRVSAARDWLSRVDGAAAAVGLRAGAGDASAYDHRRLLRERADADARVREESAALEAARARLAGVLGIDDPSSLAVTAEGLPGTGARDAGDLAAKVEGRPDLQALSREASAARLDRRAAGRSRVPGLALQGGMKTTRAAGERGWGFVAGVSLPLPFLARGQGEAEQADGRARLAEGRLELRRTEALAEARGLQAQVVAMAEAARTFRRDAVAPSGDLARTAEAAYHAGEVGVLELLDAWRGVRDASMQVLDLEAAAHRARIELARMVGEGAE